MTWPKGTPEVKGWKQAAVLTLAVLAAGCSSNSKKELPPAELTKFTEEVVLKKQWSRSIGDGQGETYNTLVPAIENDRIYAADVNGKVFALDRYVRLAWTIGGTDTPTFTFSASGELV